MKKKRKHTIEVCGIVSCSGTAASGGVHYRLIYKLIELEQLF